MNISLLPPLSAYLVGLHPLDKQGFLVEIFIRLEPKGHHSNYVSCGWFFCFNSYCYTAFGLNYFYAFASTILKLLCKLKVVLQKILGHATVVFLSKYQDITYLLRVHWYNSSLLHSNFQSWQMRSLPTLDP